MTLFATLFVTSFAVALSGVIMPGPLLTVTISESSRRGIKDGPLLIAGHAMLELALVLALLMGLAPLLTIVFSCLFAWSGLIKLAMV